MIMTKTKPTKDARWIDPALGSTCLLADGLYEISVTNDADQVRAAAQSDESDYILVGMMLPAAKGAAICQLMEDEHGVMPSPVVLLKSASPADARPSSPRLAPARPEVRLDEHTLKIRDIEIIPGRHEVLVKGRKVVLTYSEFKILHTLAQRPGWVFSREKIIYAVHGDNYNCTERAVDVQVTGLRKKLGPVGECIETVRGVGYRFSED